MPDCQHTKTRLIRLTDETNEFVKWVLHCDLCKVSLLVKFKNRDGPHLDIRSKNLAPPFSAPMFDMKCTKCNASAFTGIMYDT